MMAAPSSAERAMMVGEDGSRVATASQGLQRTALRSMSKRLYWEIDRQVRLLPGVDDSSANQVMRTICDVLLFDPHASRYSPELGRRMMDARKAKAQALGMTEYQYRKSPPSCPRKAGG